MSTQAVYAPSDDEDCVSMELPEQPVPHVGLLQGRVREREPEPHAVDQPPQRDQLPNVPGTAE